AAVTTAFVTAYNAIATTGDRSKSLVAAKNTAKIALLSYARQIYAIVQASLSVSDANKELLDIVVRKTEPTPVPVPASAPGLIVKSVSGTTVVLRLVDVSDTAKRSKPA